jgi:hypothetical protein
MKSGRRKGRGIRKKREGRGKIKEIFFKGLSHQIRLTEGTHGGRIVLTLTSFQFLLATFQLFLAL